MLGKRVERRNLLIIGAILLVIFLYLSRFGFDPTTDDAYFKAQAAQFSIGDYLHWRYTRWTGRLLPEFVLYYIFHLPVGFFHLLNLGFGWLLAYSLLRITQQKITWPQMCLLPILLGYVNFVVLHDGFLWLTGAVNYLWAAALGAYALIPFADSYFKGELIKRGWHYLIAAALFSLINEQFIVCAFGISLTYWVLTLYHRQRIQVIPLLNSVFFAAGLLFMYLAPGNRLRIIAETKHWFPNFYNLTLWGHFRVGVSWLFTALNQNFLWLLLLIAVLATTLLGTRRLRFGFYTGYLLFIAGYLVQPGIFNNFNLINTTTMTTSISHFIFCLIPYLFWSGFLLLLLSNIMLVAAQPIFLALCCAAALLSSMIMWFSPTIYGSGNRVFAAMAILLIVVVLSLIKQLFQRYPQYQTQIYQLLLVLPVINYLSHLF